LVRYEDILADPAKELSKLAPMLGIDPAPARIERTIRLSSAGHMRSLEKKQSHQWVTTKDSRQDIPFVREAKAGGWRNKLSESAVRTIEQAWGTTMKELGYDLITEPSVDRQFVK